MASDTATIRVPRATRDLLAEQARTSGVSVAALITGIAEQRRRELAWQSERAATRADADNEEAQAEVADWEDTLDDGLG